MFKRSSLILAATLVLALGVTGSAGTLGTFSGAGVVQVNGTTSIQWFGVGGITPDVFTLSDGTGIYGGHDGSINTILDLTNPPDVVGSVFPDQTFIQFTGGFAPDLLINFIEAGSFGSSQCGAPAAGGQVCSLPGSPFNFLNTDATHSSATFTFLGVTADGNAWSGVFTSQFTESYQAVFADLAKNGFVRNSYSQAEITVSSTVPEPGTTTTLASGLGLLLVSLSIKKLRRT
jgi:hypothetical protein